MPLYMHPLYVMHSVLPGAGYDSYTVMLPDFQVRPGIEPQPVVGPPLELLEPAPLDELEPPPSSPVPPPSPALPPSSPPELLDELELELPDELEPPEDELELLEPPLLPDELGLPEDPAPELDEPPLYGAGRFESEEHPPPLATARMREPNEITESLCIMRD